MTKGALGQKHLMTCKAKQVATLHFFYVVMGAGGEYQWKENDGKGGFLDDGHWTSPDDDDERWGLLWMVSVFYCVSFMFTALVLLLLH